MQLQKILTQLKTPKTTILLATLFILVGLYMRLYHIEFGLPHSFHADETQIAEEAIKYTYELRNIIKAGNQTYQLVPESYVYGMFPTYTLTIATMLYSKINNILSISFDKSDLYIFMRTVNALFSMLIIPATALLYIKLFKPTQNIGVLFAVFLTALNWKLIVHAHYINTDIFLTALLTLSFLTLHIYYNRPTDTKFTVLTGILLGLAVGTKVTALLGLPLYMYIFLAKKDIRGMVAFLFIVFGVFIASNPYAWAFAGDFVYRVYIMSLKENGLVFDSANLSPFKYIFSLNYMLTPTVLFLAGFSLFKVIPQTLKQKTNLPMHVFLLTTFLIYFVFYSMGTRLIDRWLLPALPIIIIYAAYGVQILYQNAQTKLKLAGFYIFIFLAVGTYLYYPSLLLQQYNRHTPKSQAYEWFRDNINLKYKRLVITNEGLDPFNKFEKNRFVMHVNVYESELGQFEFPADPAGYHYIVLSSKAMRGFKNPHVKQAFPFYYDKWKGFEDTVFDETKFRLVKQFVLPKPNLIDVSDVYVYESLDLPVF